MLGLDFRKKNDCKIDLQQETLQCQNNTYPMEFSSKIGCYRISAAEDISIRQGTEVFFSRGRLFEIELSSEIFNLLQISKTRTTPYHRQSDTPNRLMMEREVATPVNILNKLAMEVKVILASKWVWELQERMEDAHQFVQNHVNREMLRQKQYHDNHLSSEKSDLMTHQRRRYPLSVIEDIDSEWKKENTWTLSNVIGESSIATTSKKEHLIQDRVVRKTTSSFPMTNLPR
ncbi:unnamed protein product [Mytilus edulis]|uniref:Uncharacterized protein n=1 Tax=Mytilus edulis TaxID=6550 RepID=A0A8S3V553_MYTED|nr:unnamed protein product [Mytilus edulis]